MSAMNASYGVPLEQAQYAHTLLQQNDAGFLGRILAGFSAWSLLLTLFLAAVVYDQSEWRLLHPHAILLTRRKFTT